MKKRIIATLTLFTLFLTACGDTTNETNEDTTQENDEESLRVAVVESPMTDVVEIAQESLAEEDIELEIVEMGDYIQPNEALVNHEVDATFSQHVPFMKQFNENSEANLTDVAPIYYANFGLYAEDYDQIEDLPSDISIGIANDPSNVDRSLRLLASHDLIELNEIDGDEYSLEDIQEDSHEYTFEDAEISALSRLYDDVDSVIMNPTHASHLDLTPADDALITEKEDNKFAITLVTREDNADSDLIQKLVEAMTNEEVREFLNNREGGASIPTF
ncbi:MAG: MetQ/NlpA family ABC transporter substrate-binding protein [Atopostipes sp.]|nr:MetQ/NlpA family ABC transporter substrate-binding protein [Atopostipes sp.]